MSQKQKFTVMTWNILAPVWIRKSVYYCIPDNLLNTENRINKIASHITKTNPDILCLQEVQPSTLNILVEKLNNRYKVEGTCYNKDHYFAHWLEDKDDAYCPDSLKEQNGVALLTRDDFTGDIKTITPHEWDTGNVNMTFKLNDAHVFLCHLDAQDDADSSKELQTILQSVDVVLGDFNIVSSKLKTILDDNAINTKTNYSTAIDLESDVITCADTYISEFLDNVVVLSRDESSKDNNKVSLTRVSNISVRHTNYVKDSVTLFESVGSDHLPIVCMLHI
ncbi:endonuclease/exonuclease/phosphatase family protein [Yasminevirus sp. GU-2018]|uniref:Endonuclease/exonuclease/phosphatase family protein n=1 Tax=Yasminevirus sp. GU-2018 TaxID=2420051 RepID=A0A5K0UAI6_9VIRU|nr:endonuclease/exonuclease/phosphatase family protein [Yasminevirus sp. GU-2018]